jgi:hypothetical protein
MMRGTFGSTANGKGFQGLGRALGTRGRDPLVVLVIWAVRACHRTMPSDDPVTRLKLQLARGDHSLGWMTIYDELRTQLHD